MAFSAKGILHMRNFRIIHLNFEDDRLRGMTVDRLHLIEEAHAEPYPEFARAEKWFSIDELQDIVDWKSYARRLVDTTAEREALRHAMADAHASERRIAVQSLVSMHHMDIMQTNRISGNTSASAQKRASVSLRLPSFAGICSRRKVRPSRCLRS